MTLLQTTPKKQDLPKIRQTRSLVRGVNLRTNANVLSPASFQARKAYMVQAFQEGKFLAEPELRGKPRPNPMSDPAAMEGMMGMMKGNMAMMIPQSLIMGWINAFFSGFVISKSTSFQSFILRAWRYLAFVARRLKGSSSSRCRTQRLELRLLSRSRYLGMEIFLGPTMRYG